MPDVVIVLNTLSMRNTGIIVLLLLAFNAVKAQVAIDSAVDFTVKDLTGQQHHLYQYLDEGKFVVIDFFTTNCGPCQTYASQVSASFDYFGCNTGNTVFIGMNWGSDNHAVHVFDSTWGAYYPSVSGLQGGGNNVVDNYQVQSYPTVILIGPDRNIINNHIWPPETDTINQLVLSAGGVAHACTVGISEPELSASEVFRVAILPGNQLVFITPDTGNNQTIEVFTATGQFACAFNLNSVTTYTTINSFRRGFYIARLSQSGIYSGAVKFWVP